MLHPCVCGKLYPRQWAQGTPFWTGVLGWHLRNAQHMEAGWIYTPSSANASQNSEMMRCIGERQTFRTRLQLGAGASLLHQRSVRPFWTFWHLVIASSRAHEASSRVPVLLRIETSWWPLPKPTFREERMRMCSTLQRTMLEVTRVAIHFYLMFFWLRGLLCIQGFGFWAVLYRLNASFGTERCYFLSWLAASCMGCYIWMSLWKGRFQHRRKRDLKKTCVFFFRLFFLMGITGMVSKRTSVFGPFGVSPTGRNPFKGSTKRARLNLQQPRLVKVQRKVLQLMKASEFTHVVRET